MARCQQRRINQETWNQYKILRYCLKQGQILRLMWDNDSPTLRANHAIGDDMAMPKSPSTTRIHFQNLNGVSLHKGGTWEQCCEQWQEMEIDIALACEHKIDTNHGTNMATLHKQATEILG